MFKKILNTFFTKFFTAIAGFAILVLVSHILGTEGKGEQAIIAFNIYIITLVLTLIGNSTLIYLTPRKEFSLLFIPSLIWMFGISLLTCGVMAFIPGFGGHYLWDTVFISLIASVGEINYYVLMGKERVIEANRMKMIYPICNLVVIGGLVLLKSFDSIRDYVDSLWIAYSISLVYGIFLLRKEYTSLYLPTYKEMKESFKTLFSLGALKQAGSIAQTLNYRVSFYILAFLCGSGAVGIYSNACSIGEAVMMFGTSLALVQYSSLSNRQSNKQAKDLTIQLTRVNALFTAVALAVLCLMPESFWVLLFGEGFEKVGWVIKILAIGIMFLSCSSNFTQYFASRGNFSISATASFAGLLVIGISSFVFIRYWGITGAAISASLSYFTTFIIEFVYFLKWIKRD